MDVCVIFNPTSGRSRSGGRLRRFLDARADSVVLRPTGHRGHAVTLAREAAEEGFSTVAAAGGDGTAHEVATGLLLSGRRDVTLAVIPAGSADDYAFSLRSRFGVKELGCPEADLVDVGRVRTPCGREWHFIESLGVGLSARVTIESRAVERLQGRLLYGWAACRVLARREGLDPLEVTRDGGDPEVLPTLLISLMLGRREGGFDLLPGAVLDDGLFDVIHARNLRWWQALGLMPGLILRGGLPDHPEIHVSRCRTARLRSERPLAAHADGEIYLRPEDGVREVTVELLPGRLRVQVCDPGSAPP